jgi:DNA-binding CsgD family transcriptional regulator
MCIYLPISQSHALSGKYPIQNFTPTEYKAGIQNIDFAQNRNMTLFVANNLGILSYNGNEWELRDFESGKKKRSLLFDENTNRLYVGLQGEFGYVKDDWEYVSLVDKIPSSSQDFDEVWDVFLFNSQVYFCTFQRMYIYDGSSIDVIKNENGIGRSFQTNGKLFTQTQNGKLFEIKDKRLVPTFTQNQTNQIIAGVIPQDNGYLIIYNSGEIEHSTPFGVSRKYDKLIEVLRRTYVNHVLQLSDTRLAISTQTSGIYLFDLQNHKIENISTRDGLQTNACLRSFQDYAGNLWVGMQNGIALIDINAPMRLINQDIDIQGSGYEAYDTREGTYYTTSNGIYFLEKGASRSVFLQGTEGPAYGIQEIAGRLYAAHHTGLFLLKQNKANRLAITDGLWQVKQLRSNPAYAIGGTYFGLYLFKLDGDMTLKAVQPISGFKESSRFFEEDQKGRIWVGQFYKGLYQLNLNEELTTASVTKISDNYDLPIDEQIVLSRIDNELYLATNKGLYKLDQNNDRIVEAELFSKDIGKQPIYLLVQDNHKNVHVYARDLVGFFKQISTNNYVFVPSSLYQLRHSFNNDLLHISVNTNDGILYNANEGFIHYNPALENRISIEQPLLINKLLSISDDSVLYRREALADLPEIKRRTVLSQKAARVLQFHVESFQFKNMNDQQFRYFLKGFDEHFGEWTNLATKEYTNLIEGDYEFIVDTKDYLGEVVTSEPLQFSVRPPFHRSMFSKILYVFLGFLALYLVSRYQKMRFKRMSEKLEEAKKLEFAEKQKKLVAIENQKEQELLQLKEEKMQGELRHLNELLAESTMNLVVKNEFIENIKEELKEIKRKGKNIETKKALEKMEREIDTTLRIQKDWEQFEHHFELVHGDFLTRLRAEYTELSPTDQKLCVFLRLNLNTKEIANMMSISTRGVEIARYRLRKKLGLQKGQNLSKYVLEY